MAKRLVSKNDIKKICHQIVDFFHPCRVIIFGSYATGKATVDSDVDFLVVTNSPPRNKVVTTTIRKLLPEELRTTSMDVIAIGAAEYEETKDVVGGLPHSVSRYGEIIYENS